MERTSRNVWHFTSIALLTALLCPASWARPHRLQKHSIRVMRMEATAYVPTAKRTADGTPAHEGVAAADPGVLPLNSRIRVSGAGAYSGVYSIRDTGNKVVGRTIDLCVPTRAEAKRFGRKRVTVRVIEIGDNKPLASNAHNTR